MIIFKAKEDRAELSFNPMEGGWMRPMGQNCGLHQREVEGKRVDQEGGGELGGTIYISRISSINHILPLCF